MKILITGGGGFLGSRLAERFLQRADTEALTLIDYQAPRSSDDRRVSVRASDIAAPGALAPEFVAGFDVIFHLAAVVSGEAETDFDLGMRVNVDGARHILEACRHAGHRPRLVFTSSVAVFGPAVDGELIGDRTATEPRSAYGMEKAVSELLLCEYSRRGYVDGLVLRLPTISVRPGAPNRAASSFASGIIREPLAGLDAVCPVSADTGLWILSPGSAIDNLEHAASLAVEDQRRIVNLPGLAVTVGEMVSALGRVEGEEALAHISWKRDPAIEAIVASWPARWDDSRAKALGFKGDQTFEDIIRAYQRDAAATV